MLDFQVAEPNATLRDLGYQETGMHVTTGKTQSNPCAVIRNGSASSVMEKIVCIARKQTYPDSRTTSQHISRAQSVRQSREHLFTRRTALKLTLGISWCSLPLPSAVCSSGDGIGLPELIQLLVELRHPVFMRDFRSLRSAFCSLHHNPTISTFFPSWTKANALTRWR